MATDDWEFDEDMITNRTSEYAGEMEDFVNGLCGEDCNFSAAQIMAATICVLLVFLCIVEIICSLRNRKSDTSTMSILPYSRRHCTDLALLVSFIGFVLVTAGMGYMITTYGGDPRRFFYGIDMYGRVCGVDEGVEDKPIAAWPYPSYNTYYTRICVASCDETETSSNIVMKMPTIETHGYCLPDYTFITDPDSPFFAALFSSESESCEADTDCGDGISCVDKKCDVSSSFQLMVDAGKLVSDSMTDIYVARNLIFVSPFIAIIFCFVYLIYTRYCTGCMVASVLVTVVLGLAAVGAFLYIKSAEYVDQPDYKLAMEITAYVFWGVDALFTLIMIFLRKRILLAISVIKQASLCFFQTPSMLFFPIVPFVLGVSFTFAWIWIALYIFTIVTETVVESDDNVLYEIPLGFGLDSYREHSRNENPSTKVYYEWNDEFRLTGLYWVFAYFWIVQFFIYFTYHVLSGTVAEWYFSPRPDNGMNVPAELDDDNWEDVKTTDNSDEARLKKYQRKPCAVWRACCRTCRFHLGSVAFGSLILAIVNTLRVVCKYIESNATMIQNEKLKKAIFCAIQCCLKCLECCLDKVSRSAYVWQNVTGHSFLTSACEAFITLIRNFDRVAAVSTVSGFILFLGPIGVGACTSAAVAGYLLYAPVAEEVNTVIGPCLISFFIGIFVCKLFMTIFNTTIDTIFLCFLIDEKENSSGSMMAPIEMQKLINKYKDENAKAAEKSARYKKHASNKVEPGDDGDEGKE